MLFLLNFSMTLIEHSFLFCHTSPFADLPNALVLLLCVVVIPVPCIVIK